jgi:translation initiation factor IF-2
MVKKDDSGSGLRAGFVRGDGTAQPAKKPAPAKHEETPVKQPPVVIPEPAVKVAEDPSGPTMTMQGVSGKKITGVVKVVKAASKDHKDETEHGAGEHHEAPAADHQGPVVPAAPAPQVAAPATTMAGSRPAAPAPIGRVAPPAPAGVRPAVPAAAAPAVTTAASAGGPAAAAPAAPAAPAAQAPVTGESAAAPSAPAAATQTETTAPAAQAARPAASQSPTPTRQPDTRERVPFQGERQPYQGGYGNRPQGDRPPYQGGDRGPGQGGYGNRPQGDRPPYQGGPGQGGYGNRPQGGPGGGGYGNRPQGGPGGGGSYGSRPPFDKDRAPGQGGGYGSRPPFDKDRVAGGPGGPGSRPQGGRTGGRKGTGPDVPSELKDKLEAPRPNFATRDAFEKDSKRDDKRDVKKDVVKPTADNRDKHKTLKQQAAVLSGTGVSDALKDDAVLDTLYKEPVKIAKGRPTRGGRRNAPMATPVVRAVLTHVSLPESLTVKEFAEAIKKTAAEVIKKLIKFGIMATLNQVIDYDTAATVADEFGISSEKLVEVTEEDILFDDTVDQDDDLTTRPPVVVVMGHVDHGKTSILDRIRSATVASGEAGGITQHIGAYTVKVKNRQITFLDTPGHEAFTTMRARGAQVTDIAILVVAADDGVMPQTIEAINHAKAADTQIVVAINKIDKEGANIDRVKQELSKYELIPEEWGGTTVMVPVSAKTGAGMDELLEMVLLTADLMDLKANPDKQAKGTVIEAKLDKNRGPVATVLVQRGTLRVGDTVVTGSIIGNVRAMSDDKGSLVKKAGPSIPVEILGLPEVPEAGEIFYAVKDDKVARALAEKRRIQQREKQLRASSRMSLDTLFSSMAAGEVKDLNVIVKADVQGSVEAVRQSLEKIGNTEVRVQVIHGAVGAITETDIRLAEVSNAIVIGFNVRPATNVADLAKETGVDVRMYRVIYNAIEDIEAAMKGMLTPKFKEIILGHAQVRQVFKVTGVGTIAGSYVTDGKIMRSCEIRVVRDGIVIHEGKLASLKRFKDDAKEVATGYECGIGIDRFNDLKENDVIEAFEMQEIERS